MRKSKDRSRIRRSIQQAHQFGRVSERSASPMNLEALKDQLVQHEGLRLKPYKDTVDKLTIGVGRNLDDVGITQAEAMLLLDNDIKRVVADLDQELPWWRHMSKTRQLVLADMAFNLGLPRLKGFKKALAAMAEGRYGDAATEMLDSKWAAQVGPRALRLAQMMRTDETEA